MRLAIIVAAFGLLLGAPVIVPTDLMEQAAARQTDLEVELMAVANNPTELQAIIDREVAAGNTNGVAIALAKVAVSLALTDTVSAATLVSQAVAVSSGASSETQATVGGVASAVATTAAEAGDTNSATVVETAVASSGGAAATSYSDAGGSSGANVQISTAVVVALTTPTPSVGVVSTTPDTGAPVAPPPPPEPVAPVIVEPNPFQAGASPT